MLISIGQLRCLLRAGIITRALSNVGRGEDCRLTREYTTKGVHVVSIIPPIGIDDTGICNVDADISQPVELIVPLPSQHLPRVPSQCVRLLPCAAVQKSTWSGTSLVLPPFRAQRPGALVIGQGHAS